MKGIGFCVLHANGGFKRRERRVIIFCTFSCTVPRRIHRYRNHDKICFVALLHVDFNGLIAVRLFILSHLTYVKGTFVGSERRVRFNVFCDVQQEIWLWSAGRWFQKAGKASMTPHAADDEMGTNRHWYSAYFMYNCKFPLQQ